MASQSTRNWMRPLRPPWRTLPQRDGMYSDQRSATPTRIMPPRTAPSVSSAGAAMAYIAAGTAVAGPTGVTAAITAPPVW